VPYTLCLGDNGHTLAPLEMVICTI
jgi:hypothetical protein